MRAGLAAVTTTAGDKLAEKLHQLHSRFSHRRLTRLDLGKGLISFTFDDFPASAWTRGGEILRAHGVLATYYVSMGLEARPWHGDEGFSAEHIRQLVAQGHELGCHTFSHKPCFRMSGQELERDLERNRTRSSQILGTAPFCNFAYPFGLGSAGAKRIVGSRFATVRHIRKGVNRGWVDLAELRANEMNMSVRPRHLLSLIDTARDERGWLVFFTHDIRDKPSPWGCCPELFDFVVEAAVSSGCAVVPVREAVEHLRAGTEQPAP